MIVTNLDELEGLGRKVKCPDDGFTSFRYLLESDNMGFSMTRTEIPAGLPHVWHYLNHLEACYCISGHAKLGNMGNGDEFEIKPGTMYALDKNEKHMFMAIEDTVLICVFNPPLIGDEVHDENRSYKAS